ncbi:MAG: Gfo/Idh/MocA family protein [Pirellulales bacterium]
MTRATSTRRDFLRSTAILSAAAPYWFTGQAARANEFQSKNDRLRVGCIGLGGRGSAIAGEAARLGDIVAVCDVDRLHAESAKAAFGGKAEIYEDYRKLLERKDVDLITNGTPDHWHTAINIAACKAGKDVYTEKPLTLTIDEGKILLKVVAETGRVVQVGTQQRSDKNFQTAVELVRNGRIGKLEQVTVTLPFWTTKGGPFATKPVPANLNWDLYQGQAPAHDYCPERTHFLFRWWFEYAGGILTDWGNHHMDIAHWGMNVEHTGPLTVEGTAVFPNEGRPNCYNNPDHFKVNMVYPGGVTLLYEGADDGREGIMFTGDKGRLFVNRGGVYGKPFEELKENPLPAGAWRVRPSNDHMGNFFQCVKTREKPVSPVEIQHRTITACHLANIAIRVKRKITWDAEKQQIVGDEEANGRLKREQRAPYVVVG